MDKIKNKILQLSEIYFRQTSSKTKNARLAASVKSFDHQELKNIISCALEGWWTEGVWNEKFQEQIKDFLKVKYALTVNSGSSANLLSLMALASPSLKDRRIKAGDEVITAACAFPTTVNPILQIKAVPVFIDLELGTYVIRPEDLLRAISKRTKVVFLAHTLGNPFDLDQVRDICKKNRIWLIEDNCDALGSSFKGKATGSFADLSTLSFYPAHQITTAEGGAVVTNNQVLYKIVRSLRDWGRHCWCPTGKDNTCRRRYSWKLGKLPFGYDHKYIYSELGYNLKMTDLQSAIGVAQMKKLKIFIKKRKKNFSYLLKEMRQFEDYFILPKPAPYSDPCWFGFILTIRDKRIERNPLLKFLDKNNIGTRLLFAGNITRQPYFINHRPKYRTAGNLKNSDKITKDTFWIGLHPGLTPEMLKKTVKAFKNFLQSKKS
ncbi:MAG: lipopolysaccharide biosynthesis protein RfbH [Candidatus Omnitrophica bacterium]|nr:lipopolysaccharide biosynthesis protein RfbH [Candidatus Omnitrophota bacterium]